MGASDEMGTLRWTRCVVELVRAACHMCPTSMGVAYLEMLHKLSRWGLNDLQDKQDHVHLRAQIGDNLYRAVLLASIQACQRL
jgi:hypothetical protein